MDLVRHIVFNLILLLEFDIYAIVSYRTRMVIVYTI